MLKICYARQTIISLILIAKNNHRGYFHTKCVNKMLKINK